jgi:hypothetical protein
MEDVMDIPYSISSENQLPSWHTYAQGRLRYVMFLCPRGHGSILDGHQILDDGTVTADDKSGSVVCCYVRRGCDFDKNIRLLDWEQHKPLGREIRSGVYENILSASQGATKSTDA